MHLYADDTTVEMATMLETVPGDLAILQGDLNMLSERCVSNGLVMNPDKCSLMCIGRPNHIT